MCIAGANDELSQPCVMPAGIGGLTAHKLIQKHGNLENVLAAIREEGKKEIPDPFPFEEARRLFKGEPAALPLCRLGGLPSCTMPLA